MPLQQMLYREAYRMLCEQFEAEDAVQNLYLRLWERREQLDTLIAPDAYCLKMLRNICIDRWRVIRQRDEGTLEDEMLVADAPPDNDTKDFIEHFLAVLPKEHRRVMQMHMQGMPYDEIAALVGLSEGNIRVIISRIRKKFREIFYK